MSTRTTDKRLIAETVMVEFNLSSETFDQLPAGLAESLFAIIEERDALLSCCKTTLADMEAFETVCCDNLASIKAQVEASSKGVWA